MDDDIHYFINFMKVNNGMIIGSETIKVRKKLSFDYNEIGQILVDLKLKYGSISNDTISNISLKSSLPNNLISIVPKAGDKKSYQMDPANSTHDCQWINENFVELAREFKPDLLMLGTQMVFINVNSSSIMSLQLI